MVFIGQWSSYAIDSSLWSAGNDCNKCIPPISHFDLCIYLIDSRLTSSSLSTETVEAFKGLSEESKKAVREGWIKSFTCLKLSSGIVLVKAKVNPLLNDIHQLLTISQFSHILTLLLLCSYVEYFGRKHVDPLARALAKKTTLAQSLKTNLWFHEVLLNNLFFRCHLLNLLDQMHIYHGQHYQMKER